MNHLPSLLVEAFRSRLAVSDSSATSKTDGTVDRGRSYGAIVGGAIVGVVVVVGRYLETLSSLVELLRSRLAASDSSATSKTDGTVDRGGSCGAIVGGGSVATSATDGTDGTIGRGGLYEASVGGASVATGATAGRDRTIGRGGTYGAIVGGAIIA